MGKTPIEWADHSINPMRARNIETGAVGHFCVKVSPGCKHCYSSKMQNPYLTQLEFVAENRPKVELFLEEKAIQEVLRRRKPTDYFWNDMTDIFLADHPDEWIDRCFAAMALTPQHTHMVLTKRSERLREYFTGEVSPYFYACTRVEKEARQIAIERGIDQCDVLTEWPLPNVRLGVSVEDRQRKSRIDDLRNTPAAVRFLSIEPLIEDIGQLDLNRNPLGDCRRESGPEARKFHTAWARDIIAQCKAQGVPCFLKQLGSNPICSGGGKEWPLKLKHKKGGDMSEWLPELRVRQMPEFRP